jgi:hypothetical protein
VAAEHARSELCIDSKDGPFPKQQQPKELKMRIQDKTLLIALGILSLSTLTADAQTPRLPVYEVVRTAMPIKVDGKLNEEAWKKALNVGDFVNNSDGSKSSYKTEAKILYDENFLYFAFRCVDDNIWATLKRRDEHLWEEEVVEVFLQADPSQPSYIELEVNPLGTMLDIYLLGVRKPLHYESWNSEKLQWGVQVFGTVDGKAGDHEWTCEIALPIEDIVTAPHRPPQPGDRWRMNLYRVEHLPTPAQLAWSPTLQNDFHVPKKFGEIVFR